jgi:hypothetical protein
MSEPIDLVSGYMLDTKIKELGTLVGTELTLDISQITGELPASLGVPTTALIQVSGGDQDDLVQEASWIEATVLKSPPEIIIKGACGLTRKRIDYVIMVKTPKMIGRYFNQALSDTIEAHFPNNLHLTYNNYLLTVEKSYQQATIYLDTASGRWWNRIYVECEIYYDNKK